MRVRSRSEEYDKAYMKMAIEWSKLSRAQRKKVGCLIVSNEAIISDGYNGMPATFPNKCEYKCEDDNGKIVLKTNPEVLHAESNAITKLAKSTKSSEDATLYITLSPCLECAKLIIQSGIRRVVYLEEYRNTEGIKLLKKANLEVEKINIKCCTMCSS